MVKLNLITAPTYTDLISVATAKNFLRVTNSAEDTLIGTLIIAAVEVAQNYTNSRFLDTEYIMTMDSWTDVLVQNDLPQIILPYAPLSSIEHLKYYDSANVHQTWSASNYSVNKYINQSGFLEIDSGVTTPTLYDRPDAIEIKFKAGYGTSGSDVPESIKIAILLILGKMYEMREDSVSKLPKSSEYILDPYRFITY
tara:strand:+ start:4902 stop:5492 length:591 start_codon:yes stop_codon:yes gene_type:complete